jgi:PEP-CTERM motif
MLETMSYNAAYTAPAVPEASTLALMLVGFGGLGYSATRSRRKPPPWVGEDTARRGERCATEKVTGVAQASGMLDPIVRCRRRNWPTSSSAAFREKEWGIHRELFQFRRRLPFNDETVAIDRIILNAREPFTRQVKLDDQPEPAEEALAAVHPSSILRANRLMAPRMGKSLDVRREYRLRTRRLLRHYVACREITIGVHAMRLSVG